MLTAVQHMAPESVIPLSIAAGRYHIDVSTLDAQKGDPMRRRWLFMSILAAVMVCRAGVAYPQTADDIVEKHLAATGGRAALEKVTSRVMTGTISV